MNLPQRKLVIWFSIVIALLIAATTAVLAYAAYQSKLAHYGDIFDRVVSDKTSTWAQPALISLGGAFLVSLVLFIGFWRFYAGDRQSGDG